jgi:anaerobic selenocysteine-containing dehydrogenase
LKRMPNGNPTKPEELVIDADGRPLRIDRAYSWETPLSSHGLMHMVITNAVNRDPYPIDTLLLFMANMAWNSTMNTGGVREMLKRKDANGDYAIPFLVVVDAFRSETVNFADLVLPDTTYLERYDTISLLDRPISEPDAAADAIRHPIVAPNRDVRPFQDILVELALRLASRVHARRLAQIRRLHGLHRQLRLPGIGFLPVGARTGNRICAASRTRISGKNISRTSRFSLIASRRTCGTTGSRTRIISSSRRSTRCSARRPCR